MLKLYTMSKKNIYFCTHFVSSFVFIIREGVVPVKKGGFKNGNK